MIRETAAQRGTLRNTGQSENTRVHSLAHGGISLARLYVLGVLCAGCVVLAISTFELWAMRLPVQFWALVTVTLISGFAVLKIPGVPVNFSISDVFTLTTAVMLGPAAGAVVVAIDTLAMTIRLSRTKFPLERLLFNVAAPPTAMWLSARLFFHTSGMQPLYEHPVGLEVAGPWLLVFAGSYFFLNTFAIAVAIALHQGGRAIDIWRSHFQNLWFTFIGGALGAAFVVFALQLGTYGLVMLSVPLLLAMLLHFAYRNATGRVEDQLHHLAQVNKLHLSTIEALAHAIDAKDGVTHDHIRRVQNKAVALARRVGVVDEAQIRAIEAGALLHDVGKIAIPEYILNKPGKLTPAEFDRMKTHVRVGAEILSQVDFPYPVVPIVLRHHENWDGSGYPDGLKGDDIPIGARILAVVDCFDALTSDRPYRRALSLRQTFEIIEARSGTMYDPTLVNAFREMCDLSEEDAPGRPAAERHEEPRSLPAADVVAPEPERSSDEVRLAMQLAAAVSRTEEGCPWGALADALGELPDVSAVAIFVVSDTAEHLVPYRVSGKHAWTLKQLTIPVGERMSGWVAAVGQPMLNADATLDLFDVAADSLRSAAAIPGRGPGGAAAVITLYSTRAEAFLPLHKRLVDGALALVAVRETAARARAGMQRDRAPSSRSRLRAV